MSGKAIASLRFFHVWKDGVLKVYSAETGDLRYELKVKP